MSRAREIELRAADWLMRSEQPSWCEEEQRLLDDWLAESEAHKAAFWRLEHGWRGADRICALGSAQALAHPRFELRNWWRPVAAAASVLLVFTTIVVVGRGTPWTPRDTASVASFETKVGGHRIIGLADGSKIELNTATVIRTQVDGSQRRVWLDRGEAYFEVAKMPGQAFVVFAGPRTVTVLGTKFVVRRSGPKVFVSVVEGRVRIDEAGPVSASRSTTITTGDTAVGEGSMTLVKADSEQNVEEELAWRSGRLQFNSTTLSNAAAEFNRYNRKELMIEYARTGDIRIGGSFDARNVEAFARLLDDAYGLKVRSTPDKIFVSG
ncbi:FecR family protein [Sphingomonas sp. URHD0057]|uniref:FecR family protein n=1 Tax=Sphingomonas sp. URHD0057 TaxID=1380389 RepID=UPI00048A7113|nr:FecR domain-containing protein [Sphingomonas sp. URHD0057]